MEKNYRMMAHAPGWVRFILMAGAIIIGAGQMVNCGGDDPVVVEKPDPAVISQVSETTVAPGDTITISGDRFSSVPGENLIVFNNSLGDTVPVAATAQQLTVVVPQHAASGPMWVEQAGVRSNTIDMEILRGVGDVWVIGSGESSYSFTVPVQSGTEQYLLVAHAATQQAANFSYQVAPATAGQYAAAQKSAPGFEPPPPAPLCLHGRLQEWAEAIGGVASARTWKRPRAVSRTGAQEDPRIFYVLNTLTPSQLPNGMPNPNDFTAVTAELKKVGRRCYIYTDVNAPANGFDAIDYDYFGDLFDANIYPVDSTYFGEPTDIDENGKVIILFTPVVNSLTPPGTADTQGFFAGFFGPNDLLPGAFPEGTTNGGEIFYSFVPDPLNQFGNTFTVPQVREVVPPTLAHELEHMISTGFRMLNYGVSYIQATWLEEGMAHMAEDLNGIDGSNVARIKWYLPDPGAVPLMGSDTIQQRAAIYLFLRYVADRLGEYILKGMVQSTKVGTGTVEEVTGNDFFDTFAEWMATLYLDGRGITSDPLYRYTSIDLLNSTLFPQPLLVTGRQVNQGSFSDIVAGAAGDFYLLRNPSAPALELTVSAPASAGIRLVVVRVQ